VKRSDNDQGLQIIVTNAFGAAAGDHRAFGAPFQDRLRAPLQRMSVTVICNPL